MTGGWYGDVVYTQGIISGKTLVNQRFACIQQKIFFGVPSKNRGIKIICRKL